MCVCASESVCLHSRFFLLHLASLYMPGQEAAVVMRETAEIAREKNMLRHINFVSFDFSFHLNYGRNVLKAPKRSGSDREN